MQEQRFHLYLYARASEYKIHLVVLTFNAAAPHLHLTL